MSDSFKRNYCYTYFSTQFFSLQFLSEYLKMAFFKVLRFMIYWLWTDLTRVEQKTSDIKWWRCFLQNIVEISVHLWWPIVIILGFLSSLIGPMTGCSTLYRITSVRLINFSLHHFSLHFYVVFPQKKIQAQKIGKALEKHVRTFFLSSKFL